MLPPVFVRLKLV